MAMSKKDFQQLALALHYNRPGGNQPARLAQWKSDLESVAQACGAVNSRFDYRTFRDWVQNGQPDSRAAAKALRAVGQA